MKHNEGIQFDLDHLSVYEEVPDLEEKKMELDEVYRKAETFDEIMKVFKDVFPSKDAYTKHVVFHAVMDKFYKEVEEADR